jgi:hypothetical protein
MNRNILCFNDIAPFTRFNDHNYASFRRDFNYLDFNYNSDLLHNFPFIIMLFYAFVICE